MAKSTKVGESKSQAVLAGENVEVYMDGDSLHVVIDTSHRGGPSASGKTVRVASTLGNVKLPCGVTLGLNAYVKP